MDMKLFFNINLSLISVLLLVSCSQLIVKQIQTNSAVAGQTKAFESCYPKGYSRPTNSVSVVSKSDGQTYWEIKTSSEENNLNSSFIWLNFRTNKYGKCEFLSNTQPGQRLKYIPRDAAIELAKLHYKPYLNKFLNKCTIKTSRDQCLKEFAMLFMEPESPGNERTIVPPEDVEALRELGVTVKLHVDESPYWKLKKERSQP